MSKCWSKHAMVLFVVIGAALLAGCSREYTTELMNAAKDGNLKAVQAVVQRGADVKERSNKGKRALMFAASEGHLDVAQWLIGQGADVNAADNYGTTALIVAATAGHHDVVKLLLDNNADVLARDDSGGSALVNSVYFGHTKTVQLLLDSFARNKALTLNKRDGEELLMLAAGLGHVDIVRLMVDSGIDANGRGLKRRTPLMAAAAFDRADVAKALLELGADPQAQDDDNNTALTVAREKGSSKVIPLLSDGR